LLNNFSIDVFPENLLDKVESEILNLLKDAFEGDFSEEDLQHSFGGVRLIGFMNEEIVAHGAVVPRAVRIDDVEEIIGYVEAIAVDPRLWRQGIGTALMQEITKICKSQYQFSMLSTGEKDFYRRFGWVDFKGESYVDLGEKVVRSEEEDEGLMYLGVGKYLNVSPLKVVCKSRAGDAW
jgi:aminoglycoside 2'-N-acetyltransferase I